MLPIEDQDFQLEDAYNKASVFIKEFEPDTGFPSNEALATGDKIVQNMTRYLETHPDLPDEPQFTRLREDYGALLVLLRRLQADTDSARDPVRRGAPETMDWYTENE